MNMLHVLALNKNGHTQLVLLI